MKLRTIGSGSKGNCYLLSDEKETLIIEAGLPFIDVKRALDYDITRIVGVIVSHSHGDHAKYVKQYEKAGIKIFAPYELNPGQAQFGKFLIRPFDLVHDVPCYGFLITHPSIENMLYVTDTEYVKYRFKDIDCILTEVNYDEALMGDEITPKSEHVLTGHMSLQTCKDFIAANESDRLKNVILCHMSQTNINEEEAILAIKSVTHANVLSAHTEKEIAL